MAVYRIPGTDLLAKIPWDGLYKTVENPPYVSIAFWCTHTYTTRQLCRKGFFRVFFSRIGWVKKKKNLSTNHIKSEPTASVLSPQRKCCFSLKSAEVERLLCMRLCWSLAWLVVCTSRLLSGCTGELCNPAAGAGDIPSEPILASLPDAVPTSLVSLWEAPRFMQQKMGEKSIRWFSLTPASRPLYFSQWFLYSMIRLSWAQLVFGCSLVIVQCHGGPLKI